MKAPPDLKDFFISYTGIDVEWAKWIAECLEKAGYTTIYQKRDSKPGRNVVLQMNKAMQQTKRTIAVLSPEYLTSRFTQPEWTQALYRDPTGEYGTLIPVRVRPCDVNGIMGPIVYIDLVGLERAAASARLLEEIYNAASKPLPPTPTAPSGSTIPPPKPSAPLSEPPRISPQGATGPAVPTPGYGVGASTTPVVQPPQTQPFPPPDPQQAIGPSTRNKNPRWTVLATVVSVLVALAVLGAGLAFIVINNRPGNNPTTNHEPTPTATSTPTLTTPTLTTPTIPAGFKLYTDTDGGFSITYPSGWSMQKATNGRGMEFDGPGERKLQATNAESSQHVTAEGTVDSFLLGAFCFTNDRTTVTIARQQWTRKECDDSLKGWHILAEAVAYKGSIYLIVYSAPRATFTDSRSKYFTMMEQSFQFLI